LNKTVTLVATVLALIPAVTGCGADARRPYLSGGQKVFQSVDTQKNMYVHHNIYYVKHGTIHQTLDLFVPAFAKKPFPLIIWIHGGSWAIGDKSTDCVPCRSFGDKYAIATVNYRFAKEAPFPTQLHDVKAAVRYLRSNAKMYGIDPDRIGVWGSSAGGYLAALLGTTGDVDALNGKLGITNTSNRVKAVVDWSAPTNFSTAEKQAPPTNKIRFRGPGSPVYDLMGARMDEKSLKDASPVSYVTQDDPPFLIMHGTSDDAIPVAQSEELFNALKKAGVPAELKILKGQGHSLDTPENAEVVRQFFDRNL